MKKANGSVLVSVGLLLGCHGGWAQTVVVPTQPLNDTGMTGCYEGSGRSLSMSHNCGTEAIPGQDGNTGRDVDEPASENGWMGFSFRKICHSGEYAGSGQCPKNPGLGDLPNNWGCTEDTVTGLVWEVKSKSGLRAYWINYFDGNSEAPLSSGVFVKSVNSQGLCGANDWRLPTVTELQSIVNYDGSGTVRVSIDRSYFPRILPRLYMTSERNAKNGNSTWGVSFWDGRVLTSNYMFPICLVRSGR